MAEQLLADPLLEDVHLVPPSVPEGHVNLEVQRKPGVMDPAEASVIKGAGDSGLELLAVRQGRRVTVAGLSEDQANTLAWKLLANQAIEDVAVNPIEAVRFPGTGAGIDHQRTEVDILAMDDEALMTLSRDGCLSLDIDEMQTVQKYFKDLGRLPTDIELESIAQTWSEHCVPKPSKV